ncbi:hypothetical protein RDI58_024409 [Solanum bulbocastanum]|uniref:Uncharacterized protein n=1 Tax=Solanum bulbocastanum TaxID=147425 RepID=A0AAN8T3A6_SOLBU
MEATKKVQGKQMDQNSKETQHKDKGIDKTQAINKLRYRNLLKLAQHTWRNNGKLKLRKKNKNNQQNQEQDQKSQVQVQQGQNLVIKFLHPHPL